MKKLVIIAFAILLSSCTQTKIAYIDVEVLMNDYKESKLLEEKLQTKQEQLASELDSLQEPFQLKVQEYYKNASKMSATQRQEAEEALQREQQFLQTKQQQASQQLQMENQANNEAITKKVDSIVGVFGKENGYEIILGTSGKGTVMYGDEKLDITTKILEKLNKDFSEEK